MRKQLSRILISLSVSIAYPGISQVAAPSPTQLQAVQAQAYSALMTTAHPTSIVLNGTFASTEGSLSQNGNAQLTVGSDGTVLINLSRTIGPISEARTVSYGIPACTWTDQESVVHNGLFLNCMPPAWFFPGLTLLASSGDTSVPAWTPSSYASDSLGVHLRFKFIVPDLKGAEQDPLLSSLFDLVLAPDTHLPQYALFTVHPDNPAINADIPVRIAYSNYRSVSGVMVPFHIQRYVNDSLVLDLAISTASVQ